MPEVIEHVTTGGSTHRRGAVASNVHDDRDLYRDSEVDLPRPRHLPGDGTCGLSKLELDASRDSDRERCRYGAEVACY